MGINCMNSSLGNTQPPNPDPRSFKIASITKGELFDLIEVKYYGCTTFRGIKLLVVEKGSVTKKQLKLDPHFLEDNQIVARFRADSQGLLLANYFIKNMTKDI